MRFKLAIAIVLLGHMIVAQQNRQFFTGGGCPAIRGVGHPVLMISHVHKFINDALNSKNSYTSVDFIYHNKSAEGVNGMSTYIFVFRLNAISQTMFLGIKFEAGNFNTMRLVQYMKLESLTMTGNVLGVDDIANKLNNPECGDLKYMFSFYGQSPTPNLPYTNYGRNGNSIGAFLLANLQNPSEKFIKKDCFFSNYEIDIVLHATTRPLDPLQNDFKCNSAPSTHIPVHSIRMYCNAQGTVTTASGPRSNLRYLQLIFNDPSGDGTIDGIEFEADAFVEADITEFN